MAAFTKPRNKSKEDKSSGSPRIVFMTTVLINGTHVATRSLDVRIYCKMF